MTFVYQPQPTWTLFLPGEELDLTPYVLSWQVTYGCQYDANVARFRLLTANGFMELDNRTSRFDLRSRSAIVTVAQAAHPQLVRCQLGGRTLWQGLAMISGEWLLTPARTVQWQLRGRYWQGLRSEVLYAQRIRFASPTSLLAELLERGLNLRDGTTARDAGSLDADDVRLKHAYFAASLAGSINDLAWASASVPYEGSEGKLGLRPPSVLGSSRVAPSGQRVLDGTRIESVGTMSNWAIVATARNLVPEAARVNVTAPAPPGASAGVRRYRTPSDVVAVDWDRVTQDQGAVSLNYAYVQPASDGSRDYELVYSINTAGDRLLGLNVMGTAYKLDADEPYDQRLIWRPDGAARNFTRRQQPPPWLEFARPDGVAADAWAPERPWEQMMQWINEPKLVANLEVPLWGPTEDDAATVQQLQIGTGARYRLSATETVDLMTLAVTLQGGTDVMPRAMIEAMSWSGFATPPGIAPSDTIVNPEAVTEPEPVEAGDEDQPFEFAPPGETSGASPLLSRAVNEGISTQTTLLSRNLFTAQNRYDAGPANLGYLPGVGGSSAGAVILLPDLRVRITATGRGRGAWTPTPPPALAYQMESAWHDRLIGDNNAARIPGRGFVQVWLGRQLLIEQRSVDTDFELDGSAGFSWNHWPRERNGQPTYRTVARERIWLWQQEVALATVQSDPPNGEALPANQWVRVVWQWSNKAGSALLNGASFGAMPLDFGIDKDTPEPQPSLQWQGQDASGVPLNPRMGKRDPSRKPVFAVIHHAGSGRSASELTVAENVFAWQKRQNEYRGSKPVYSGYNFLLDANSDIDCMDPLNVRAYHAAAGNDGMGLMLGADDDWSDITPEQLRNLLQRTAGKMRPYSIAARHATSLADARANGGIIGHDEIQSNKRDPGPTFPYDDLVALMS